MKTYKILGVVAVAVVMSLLIAVGLFAQTTTSNDVGKAGYSGSIFGNAGLRGIQDATPAVAILSWPEPSHVTTSIVTTVTDDLKTTNSVTNVVQTSAYIPISWDSTLWPIATPSGVKYRFALITNPPLQYVWANGTGATITNSVVAYLATNIAAAAGASPVSAFTNIDLVLPRVAAPKMMPISNLWYNTTGLTTGWKLIHY